MSRNKTMRNSFLLFLTACIWGMAFVSQSKGMESMGPFTFNGIRSLLGAGVVFPVVLVRRNSVKKDAEKALTAFTEVVSKELKKGGKVQLVGFGTFEVAERAAREGRNPQTGETMKIAAAKAPKFKAGKALKDEVNR